MTSKGLNILGGGALALLLVFGTQTTTVQAQGRGGGHGGGGSMGGGGGMGNSGMGGRPSSPGMGGVDRGIGTSSDRSSGRSDAGRAHASDSSNGRSDRGTDHARAGRHNGSDDANNTDSSSRRFTGLAHKLNTDPATLQAQYNAALATNPNLKFGQFVAANVLASNLGAKNPNVTTSAILSGLQNGSSIGQTLQNLGVSKSDAKKAEKQAKHSMKNNDDQDDR